MCDFFCSLHPTLLLFEFAVVVVIALNGTALTTERASSVPHYSFLFRSEKERERERIKRETKCKICEYLHNWMIWYSIRQFECLSSLWCVRVERPTSSKDRFVYISSLSHSMLLHLFKEIFRTTYTSVTRERGRAGEDENKWFVWQNASRETELKYTDPESFDRSEKTYVISDF